MWSGSVNCLSVQGVDLKAHVSIAGHYQLVFLSGRPPTQPALHSFAPPPLPGDRQFFFLNGRPVDLPKATKALNECYRALSSPAAAASKAMAVVDFRWGRGGAGWLWSGDGWPMGGLAACAARWRFGSRGLGGTQGSGWRRVAELSSCSGAVSAKLPAGRLALLSLQSAVPSTRLFPPWVQAAARHL